MQSNFTCCTRSHAVSCARPSHGKARSFCTHKYLHSRTFCTRSPMRTKIYEYVYTQHTYTVGYAEVYRKKRFFAHSTAPRLWRLLPWPRGIKQPTLGRTYTPRRPNSTENKLLRVKNFNTTMSSQETATCTTCRKFSSSWYVQLINLCTYTLSLSLSVLRDCPY